MAIRKTDVLLNVEISASTISESRFYSPTNAQFFSLYCWVNDNGGGSFNDLTVTVTKYLEGIPIKSTINQMLTLTAAEQAAGDRLIFNSDVLLPAGLCPMYKLDIASASPLDAVTLRLISLEA